MIANSLCAGAVFSLIGSLSRNVSMANVLVPGEASSCWVDHFLTFYFCVAITVMFFLFAGFLTVEIPDWWIWLYYWSFFRYTYQVGSVVFPRESVLNVSFRPWWSMNLLEPISLVLQIQRDLASKLVTRCCKLMVLLMLLFGSGHSFWLGWPSVIISWLFVWSSSCTRRNGDLLCIVSFLSKQVR